jgi:hypothetical protein
MITSHLLYVNEFKRIISTDAVSILEAFHCQQILDGIKETIGYVIGFAIDSYDCAKQDIHFKSMRNTPIQRGTTYRI